MTNKIPATAFIVLSAMLLSGIAYFAYETHQSYQRIDAMARTLLERLQK